LQIQPLVTLKKLSRSFELTLPISVSEQDDFLTLFPHRYDYIWAVRPTPGQKPQWQTESRHPLSDRHILEGEHLYGVRFGPQTQYLLIDIDAGSRYHPKSDRLAISHLVSTLEPLGLVSYVACSSSYSGGLHLYFPFEEAQKTWDLAFAVQSLLKQAGFDVRQGQLELFPNPKLYVPNGTPGLYAAHRLPLQEPGSYILDADWTPRSSSRHQFVEMWQWASGRNTVSTESIVDVVEKARFQQRGLSRSATKFLNDLNTEIEQGWTGFGQTNRLLGRIAMRSYIFGHLLYGSAEPIEGDSLIRDIVQTAQHLPGYREWCRHQHEIEKRAEDWARCIENSDYFPYRLGQKKLKRLSQAEETQTWNQQQSDSARTRIQQAIAHLLNANSLPSTTTLRFKALVSMGIGGSTLYRHRDLWHPNHISEVHEISGEPLCIEDGAQSLGDYAPSLKSLLAQTGRNAQSDESFTHPDPNTPIAGRNCPAVGSDRQPEQERMESYLHSGDPILMAEAQRWMAEKEEVAETSSTEATIAPAPSSLTIHSRESYQLVVEAIAYHLAQLGWNHHQISDHLMRCTGKPLQPLLNDEDLVRWLHYLETIISEPDYSSSSTSPVIVQK